MLGILVFASKQPLPNDIQSEISTLLPWASNQPKPNGPSHQLSFKFAVLSDTHEDTQYFPNIAGQIAKRNDIDFVAHLGDLSNAGDKNALIQAKSILDRIPEPVYVLPGDHDFNWIPQHDLANFKSVFDEKKTYYSINHKGVHFIFVDNSDLNNGINPAEWQWLVQDLNAHAKQPIYVFMSTPLSNPYIAYKAMGARSNAVAQQAKTLGQLLTRYPVKATLAGDTHTYAQYKDEYSQLQTITVGAAGSTKNLLPLYVVIEIFTDGSYNASSVAATHAIPVQGND